VEYTPHDTGVYVAPHTGRIILNVFEGDQQKHLEIGEEICYKMVFILCRFSPISSEIA